MVASWQRLSYYYELRLLLSFMINVKSNRSKNQKSFPAVPARRLPSISKAASDSERGYDCFLLVARDVVPYSVGLSTH